MSPAERSEFGRWKYRLQPDCRPDAFLRVLHDPTACCPVTFANRLIGWRIGRYRSLSQPIAKYSQCEEGDRFASASVVSNRFGVDDNGVPDVPSAVFSLRRTWLCRRLRGSEDSIGALQAPSRR